MLNRIFTDNKLFCPSSAPPSTTTIKSGCQGAVSRVKQQQQREGAVGTPVPLSIRGESSAGEGQQHQHLVHQQHLLHHQNQQGHAMWTGAAPPSSLSGSISSKITPTETKVINFMQKLQELNLSTPGPGAWLESPARGPAPPPPSWTVRHGSVPSSGRGKGARSYSGVPVILKDNSTLCATVLPYCKFSSGDIK